MEREELAKKYGINLENLEEEQIKLAKGLKIGKEDCIDLKGVQRIGAVESFMIKNKIVSVIVVCDKDFEVLEEVYFTDSLRFPYIHGFKAYREVPSMLNAYKKLEVKPDVVFVKGEGINHARLGIASHFSLAAEVPVIGISDGLFEGNELKKDSVMFEGKKVGISFLSKKGSKPLIVSPGNLVSVSGSLDFVKSLIVEPHKLPEPMVLAHKYAKDIRKELMLV